MPRVIMHVDMDAFYASIEQRDHPEYRGLPVIVGADPKGGRGRGVVCAASYEARKFGVRSALPISQAYKRCPHGIFLPVRGKAYAKASLKIMEIFKRYTPVIEPVSLDEAFLDLSGCIRLHGDVEAIGQRIKRSIKNETGLTASVGIGPTKMVAKIASDLEKPNGFVSVKPLDVIQFLQPLAIGKLWGIGKKTEARLQALGLVTIGDIQEQSFDVLEKLLGPLGRSLYAFSHGEDITPVISGREAKSVSNETTFGRDTTDHRQLVDTVVALADKVAYRLRKQHMQGRTITLKIRFQDFSTRIRHHTLPECTHQATVIRDQAIILLEDEFSGLPVRLIGVGVTQLMKGGTFQGDLFRAAGEADKKVSAALDQIRDKFGYRTIQQGAVTWPGSMRTPFGPASVPENGDDSPEA